MRCGCYDDSSRKSRIGKSGWKLPYRKPAELKKDDALFCFAPICTPDDDEWEPCNDTKKSSKGSKSGESNDDDKEGRKLVKTITACIMYEDGSMEEKCVDPFYFSTSDNSSVVDVMCGSCTNIL